MRATLSQLSLPEGYRLLWYEIQSVLGEGGFGITYAAVDGNLNHHVAIKEYFPRGNCTRGTLREVSLRTEKARGEYEWGLRRFVDEARTLAQFRHPNIVHVRTAFEHNGTAYMVMDLERGQTLSEVAQTPELRDEARLLDLIGPLLHGLQQVHEAGFIHRDIKLDNIIVRNDGTPVLVDFGSSRVTTSESASSMTALVTRGYAPFEQYATDSETVRQGPWGDVYSFAAALYALVTGRVPYDSLQRSAGILSANLDPLTPASSLAAGKYSPELLEAIDAGLAFAAHERPQSVQEWASMFPAGLRLEAKAPNRIHTLVLDGGSPQNRTFASSEAVTELPERSGAAAENPQTTELDGSVGQMRTLVVDDEAYVRSLAVRVLDRVGIKQISQAGNGREALDQIEAHGPFDVILLDLRMSDMDGIEFLRVLSKTGLRPSIILVSGVDTLVRRGAEEFARSNGFFVLGSTEKPLRPDKVRALLERHIVEARTVTVARPAPPELSEAEFLAGLQAGALVPYYQPKVTVAGRIVTGVETLARWRTPRGEIIGPAAFVPMAERTQNIHEMTLVLLRSALHDCGEWNAQGIDLQLAVNVSAASFTDLQFPDFLEAEAAAQGVDLSQITLEITERMVADDIIAMMDILMRLRIKGITLSIDDFGTGYSSLQQLHRLPFTELKVDREFVAGADRDPRAHSILEASVVLARNLNMATIAEGVETDGDWRTVGAVGCDMVQGFLIAKPMPKDELLEWLEHNGYQRK